jgi:hypothetical protein
MTYKDIRHILEELSKFIEVAHKHAQISRTK